jgi:hypothetical protein
MNPFFIKSAEACTVLVTNESSVIPSKKIKWEALIISRHNDGCGDFKPPSVSPFIYISMGAITTGLILFFLFVLA